jgi:hypothetical protein
MIVHGPDLSIVPVDLHDLPFMGIQADPVPYTDGSVDGDDDPCEDIRQKRLKGKAQDDGHDTQRCEVPGTEFRDILAEEKDDEEGYQDDLDEVSQKLRDFILLFLDEIVVKKDDIYKGKEVVKKDKPDDQGEPGIDIGDFEDRHDFQADVKGRKSQKKSDKPEFLKDRNGFP